MQQIILETARAAAERSVRCGSCLNGERLAVLQAAAGAALGASLPATKQEDQLLGEPADKLKRQASDAASQAYAEGKRQVSDAYDEVSERAAELYGDAKDKLGKTAASDKTMH